MRHGFIWFWNIAQAIYKWLKINKENSFCYISKTNAYKEIPSCKTLKELIESSEVIWICVKPQNIIEVLCELKGLDFTKKIIVSPVAGKKTSLIEKYLWNNVNIVRIMPNLAIAYKKSVNAFFTNKETELLEKVKKDIMLLWELVEIEEKDFDLFTAIFWSWPAFLLSLFEAFNSKIKQLHINTSSEKLLLELLDGTMSYYKNNYQKNTINTLIKKVTSKWWTTEAWLWFLEEKKTKEIISWAIQKAKDRGEELWK